MLTRNTAAASSDSGQLNTKRLCKVWDTARAVLRCCTTGPVAVRLTVAVVALTMRQVLERHATHGSPKLEFAVLQELLEELGFEFTPGDIALVNRQFDNKNTGWVTYRDLVRFMTAGYSAVQVRVLFVCSRPRVLPSGVPHITCGP